MGYTKAMMIYRPFTKEALTTNVVQPPPGQNWDTDTNPNPDTANTKASDTPTTDSKEPWGFINWTAMVKEAHSVSNEITSYPVSTGFNVSNHTIKRNRVLVLNGIVANVKMNNELFDPLTLIPEVGGAILGTGAGAVLASAMNLAKIFITPEDTKSNDVLNTFLTLQQLCLNGSFVHVTTILGPYVNCVIRSVDCEQDESTASILSVRVVLEELQVIGSDDEKIAAASWLQDHSKESFEWEKYVKALGINVAVALAT